MNVLIMGYGRMGHEVETILKQRGHNIVARVDRSGYGDTLSLEKKDLERADTVIEFALPDGIFENAKLYSKYELKAVIGTTGWEEREEEILSLFQKGEGAYLYGSNFSIGAHLFFKMGEYAASLINRVEDYDISVLEYHHNKKKDSPSGTAITTANKVLNQIDRKKTLLFGNPEEAIQPEELQVSSLRLGSIPGMHKILMDSPADTIELSHDARTRGGFALGSVMAAEWLQDKNGSFSVDNFIDSLLG